MNVLYLLDLKTIKLPIKKLKLVYLSIFYLKVPCRVNCKQNFCLLSVFLFKTHCMYAQGLTDMWKAFFCPCENIWKADFSSFKKVFTSTFLLPCLFDMLCLLVLMLVLYTHQGNSGKHACGRAQWSHSCQ